MPISGTVLDTMLTDSQTDNAFDVAARKTSGEYYPPDTGNTANNAAIYGAQGDEFLLGSRTRQLTNAEGDKHTEFVPPPPIDVPQGWTTGHQRLPGTTVDVSQAVRQGTDMGTTILRTVGSAANDLAKGVATVGEWGLDQIAGASQGTGLIPDMGYPISAGIDNIFGTNLGDPNSNYVSEHWPSVAAESETERTVTQVMSIVAGALTGTGLVSWADDVAKISPKIADTLRRVWPNFMTKRGTLSAEQATRRLEHLVRFTIIGEGVGGSTGAAIATPDDADPLFGQIFAGDNDKLAHYIDNLALLGPGMIIAGIAGKTIGWVKNFLVTENPDRLIELIKEIDPGAAHLNWDDAADRAGLIERAKALEEAIQNNTRIALGTMSHSQNPMARQFSSPFVPQGQNVGNVTVTPVEAMIRGGAAEYTQKMYGSVANQPANYLETMAQNLGDNMLRTAQAVTGNTALMDTARASVNEQMRAAFEQFTLSNTPNASDAARNIAVAAQPSANRINTQTTNVANAQSQLKGRQTILANSQDAPGSPAPVGDATAVNREINDTRNRVGNLGSQQEIDTIKAQLSDTTFNQWNQDWATNKSLWDNIPEGTMISGNEVGEQIQKFRNRIGNDQHGTDLLAALGLRRNVDGPMSDDAAIELMDVLQENGGVDFKDLYSLVRRRVANLIDIERRQSPAMANGNRIGALTDLKKWIDEVAARPNISGPGGPAEQAMTYYKDYAGRWHDNEILSNFDDQGRQLVQDAQASGGLPTGPMQPGTNMGANVGRAGIEVIDNVLSDPTRRSLPDLMNAMQATANSPYSKQLNEVITLEALVNLTTKLNPAERVNSQAVREGMAPFLSQLEQMEAFTGGPSRGRSLLQKVNALMAHLPGAEESVENATRKLLQVQTEARQVIGEVERGALYDFLIQGQFDMFRVKDEPGITESLRRIFNGPDSTDQIKNLIDQAGPNKALVTEGLKGEYMRYLMSRIWTTTPINVHNNFMQQVGRGLSGQGWSPTTTVRGSALNDLTGIDQSSVDNMLDHLFGTTGPAKDQADDIKRLMGEMRISNDILMVRPQLPGSPTAYNINRNYNRIITAVFGTLNRTATMMRNIGSAIAGDQNQNIRRANELTLALLLTDHTVYTRMNAALGEQQKRALAESWAYQLTRGAMATDNPASAIPRMMTSGDWTGEEENYTVDNAVNNQMRSILSPMAMDTTR